MSDTQESNDGFHEDRSETDRSTNLTSDINSDSSIKRWLKPDTPPEISTRIGRIERSITAYSGPLPPASELGKYEEVHSGAADRIITLAENTQKTHDKAITGHINLSRLSIITSSVLSGLMISAAGLAIVYDPAWLSIPLGSVGIGVLLLQDWFRRMRN